MAMRIVSAVQSAFNARYAVVLFYHPGIAANPIRVQARRQFQPVDCSATMESQPLRSPRCNSPMQ
eukprot:1779222-Amphidinium_carterae.1